MSESESLNQSGGFNVGEEEEEVSVVMVVVVVGALSSTFFASTLYISSFRGVSSHTVICDSK